MKAVEVVSIFCTTVYFVWIDGNGAVADMSKFKLHEFYLCEKVPNQIFYFFVNPKNFNAGLRLVNINMSLPSAVGNDMAAKALFEIDSSLTTKHSWMYLFHMEDDLCKMLDRYSGPLWCDTQRALGISPFPRGLTMLTTISWIFKN